MTKLELIERVAQRLEKAQRDGELPKKTVAMVVDTVFAELGDYFVKARVARPGRKKTPRFTYPGFGTFTKKEKSARAGRDPRSGETIEIPARTTVAFSPGQELKAELNRPRERAKARRG
jgi:DNA-binding protein HU-beta